jgi:Na+-transporting NADH:ubiquinone oxidoreductase subunit C
VGKKIYGEKGSVQLHLVKGVADKSSPEAAYQVDGLSGATLTADGVTDLVKYWLGDDGFKKLLLRLQAEGA